MNFSFRKVLSAAALFLAAAAAHADYVDVNLAGWKTVGLFGDVSNTQTFLNIGAGSSVTGYDYTGLTFATNGFSYLDEFVLSVNDLAGTSYMDWAPSTFDGPGVYGPMSGSWNGPTGFGAGSPFSVAANGILWVTVYELYDDLGVDAMVSAGNLRIFYTPSVVAPVPEPSTWAFMAFGLLAVTSMARRRARRL